jgi:C-terminal processing protease CtpA/Prc
MKRSVFVPVLVAFFSVAAGGWLLQQGVDRAENVYVRVRVLQEVVDRVESSFVDEVDPSSLYNSAIDGLIRDLGDPHSAFMPAAQFRSSRICASAPRASMAAWASRSCSARATSRWSRRFPEVRAGA